MLFIFFQFCLLLLKLAIEVTDGVNTILIKIYDVLDTPNRSEEILRVKAPVFKMLLKIVLLLLKLACMVTDGVYAILVNIYNTLLKEIENEESDQEESLREGENAPEAMPLQKAETAPEGLLQKANIDPEEGSSQVAENVPQAMALREAENSPQVRPLQKTNAPEEGPSQDEQNVPQARSSQIIRAPRAVSSDDSPPRRRIAVRIGDELSDQEPEMQEIESSPEVGSPCHSE